jgi:HrpA-like RNA helicase
MVRALEFLYCLKAIDGEGRLTRPMGERVAEVPLDPMMATIVSAGRAGGASDLDGAAAVDMGQPDSVGSSTVLMISCSIAKSSDAGRRS